MRDDDVRRRLAMVSLIAAAYGLAFFGEGRPVAAQTIPEGQSCGGLVCDLGLFGHETTPRAPAPSPAQTIVGPSVAAEPKTAKVHKPKRFAKAVAPLPNATAAPAARPAPAPPTATLPPPTSIAGPTSPVAPAAGKPAVAAASVPPDRGEVYIRPNPYTTGLPAPTLILPIGPAPPQP